MKKLIPLVIMLVFVGFLLQNCKKDENNDDSLISASIIYSPEEVNLNDFDSAFVYISTQPEKEISWVAVGPAWLKISPTSGTLNGDIAELKIVSDVSGMDEGYYSANIEVISNSAGKGYGIVRLSVGSNPVAEITPQQISIPGETDSILINVHNTGTGYLNWELSGSESWIEFSKKNGSCATNESTDVYVSVNRNGMAVGSYTGFINLTSNSTENTAPVSVEMQVGETALMDFSSDTLDFNIAFEQKEIYLINSGNTGYSWQLTIDESYLTADNLSGNLTPGDSTLIKFTIDRDQLEIGQNRAKVHFSNDKGRQADLNVQAFYYQDEKWLLDCKIIDAEYDRNADVIIAVTDEPFKLLKLNPETETRQEVDLNLLPICVSVQSDGTHAVVGHDSKVTYVDLTTMTTNDVFNVPVISGDIVLADNNYAYVFPKTGQWTKISCLNLTNGQTSESTGNLVRHNTKAKLHPSGDYIYGANNGVSPSDFEKYDITQGVAEYMYDSPYHGDYSFGGNVWISDDGQRLFAKSRNVFLSSTNQINDMIYNGQLTGESTLVTLDHSGNAKSVFSIEYTGDSWDYIPSNIVKMYESEYLVYYGSKTLPDFIVPTSGGYFELINCEGHFGFFNSLGTKFYVLVKAREGSTLINDWAVATLDVN